AGGEFELIGYTTDTIYTDTLDTGGLYCYYATAVYDQCESGPSNDTCVECWVGIEELISESSVNVYPNPASDFVNVVSTENITKITVINYVGQVVYEKKVVEETSIMLNTASYETGVYMIKVETEDGITAKRVAITR
ncbi:MAG: T9SS type A sorting domain-containing protein, partial [Bacteroidales bacterium]|nr:T9SS type A sorting domain-containing protein [Bacteroidales bacterium]